MGSNPLSLPYIIENIGLLSILLAKYRIYPRIGLVGLTGASKTLDRQTRVDGQLSAIQRIFGPGSMGTMPAKVKTITQPNLAELS